MRVDITPYVPSLGKSEHPIETSFYTDYEQKDMGTIPLKVGKLWLEVEVQEWGNEHPTIEVTTSLDNHLNGGAALLPPSSDNYSLERYNVQRTLDYNPGGENSGIYIECKSWDLGKESRLTIHRSPNIAENLSFKLLLLLRPHFLEVGEKCKLNFNIVDKKTPDYTLLDDDTVQRFSEIELICSNELPKDESEKMQRVHNVFNHYSAYNYDGRGNSLHPKQNLTIRGLQHIISQMLRDKDDIKIGYIGTDTTENFCSMLRWLEDSETIKRVSAIEAWYTNEWDAEFIDWLSGTDHPLICHQKVEYFEISPELIKQSKPCDIIISTYVSPWAGLYDEQYQELLTNLMSETSFLLSVDPQSAEKSVRLPLIGKINNQILYKDILSFIPAKPPVTKENSAVEWTIWKRRKSTTGAN